MKKTLIVLFTVLLIAGLFVSCSSSPKKAEEPTFTVTFDVNGGTGEVAPITGVKYGEKITEPICALTKAGYVFNGWTKVKDDYQLWHFDTDIVTEDITLYAAWGDPQPE